MIEQERIKKEELKKIRTGGKSEEQKKKAMANVNMLFKGRNDAIEFVNCYGSIILEVKIKATEDKGFKIETSKQMLQRLPIALAQIQAGNTSKNLLNEFCQLIYSLYQAKEITKKVYNNIII